MSTTSVIVLDFDGTLLDTSSRHYAVYQMIAKKVGIKPLQFSDYWKLRRTKLSNMAVLLKDGLPNSKRNVANTLWLNNIETVDLLTKDKLFPGVLNWLQKHEKKVEFILSTLRSNSCLLELQIKSLGLSHFFKQIKVVQHQTDPSMAKALSVLNDIPRKILAWVGDTEVDIDAAHRVGTLAIGVTSGMRTSAYLKNAGADKIFNYITEIEMWN